MIFMLACDPIIQTLGQTQRQKTIRTNIIYCYHRIQDTEYRRIREKTGENRKNRRIQEETGENRKKQEKHEKTGRCRIQDTEYRIQCYLAKQFMTTNSKKEVQMKNMQVASHRFIAVRLDTNGRFDRKLENRYILPEIEKR